MAERRRRGHRARKRSSDRLSIREKPLVKKGSGSSTARVPEPTAPACSAARARRRCPIGRRTGRRMGSGSQGQVRRCGSPWSAGPRLSEWKLLARVRLLSASSGHTAVASPWAFQITTEVPDGAVVADNVRAHDGTRSVVSRRSASPRTASHWYRKTAVAVMLPEPVAYSCKVSGSAKPPTTPIELHHALGTRVEPDTGIVSVSA